MSFSEFTLLIIFFVYIALHSVNSTIVTKCPENQIKWREKTVGYSCKDEYKTYHCIRRYNHGLVEVCLRRALIQSGKVGCPWIHILDDGSVIYGAIHSVCADKDTCPGKNHRGYFTDELYKYPGCIKPTEFTTTQLDLVNRTEPPTFSSTKPSILEESFGIIKWTILTTYPTLTLMLIVFYCAKNTCANRKNVPKSRRNSEEVGEAQVAIGGNQLEDEPNVGSPETYHGIRHSQMFLVLLVVAIFSVEVVSLYWVVSQYFSFFLKEITLVCNLSIGIYAIIKEYILYKSSDLPKQTKNICNLCSIDFGLLGFILVGLKRFLMSVLSVVKCNAYSYLLFLFSSVLFICFVILQSRILLKSRQILPESSDKFRFYRLLSLTYVNAVLIVYAFATDIVAVDQNSYDRELYGCIVGVNASYDPSVTSFFKHTFQTNLPYLQAYGFYFFLFYVFLLYKTNILKKNQESHSERTERASNFHLVLTFLCFIVCFSQFFLQIAFKEYLFKLVNDICMHIVWLAGLIVFHLVMRRSYAKKLAYIEFDKNTGLDYVIFLFFLGAFISYTVRIFEACSHSWGMQNGILIAHILLPCITLLLFLLQTFTYFVYSAVISKQNAAVLSKIGLHEIRKIYCMSLCYSFFNLVFCIIDFYKNTGNANDLTAFEYSNSQFALSVVNLYRFFIVVGFSRIAFRLERKPSR